MNHDCLPWSIDKINWKKVAKVQIAEFNFNAYAYDDDDDVGLLPSDDDYSKK